MYAYSTMPAAAIVSSRNALPLFLWWGMLYNYTKNGSVKVCLRKRPTVCDATTGLDKKWRLCNKRRNSILMTRHYPELGSASDWLYRKGNLLQPISTLPRAEKGHVISIKFLQSFFSHQTSFHEETSGGIAKCRLFSQAPTITYAVNHFLTGLHSQYIYRLMKKR